MHGITRHKPVQTFFARCCLKMNCLFMDFSAKSLRITMYGPEAFCYMVLSMVISSS